MTVDRVVPEAVDYVFPANTFHGILDRVSLARAVAATLKPEGLFGIVNWYRHPRVETVVLGQRRGPKTEMRIGADEVASIAKSTGSVGRVPRRPRCVCTMSSFTKA
jgi:hypothetical protein